MCETVDGAPIDMRSVAIAAIIGRIRRIVIDTAGRVIDLGRTSRVFRGAAREAVLFAGKRCCWPGCANGHVQLDHINPWAQLSGLTNPANGAPLCPVHNRSKHTARITVHRNQTGWHFHRPNGTEIAPRAP